MASKYIPSWEMQMRLHKPLSTATAVFMAAACSGGNASCPATKTPVIFSFTAA